MGRREKYFTKMSAQSKKKKSENMEERGGNFTEILFKNGIR